MRTLKRDNLAEVHFDERLRSGRRHSWARPGRGFPVLGSALDMGRFSVAARCVGQAQRCIDLAVPYALDREAFGQKIGEFQMIQQKIADMIGAHRGRRGQRSSTGSAGCRTPASAARRWSRPWPSSWRARRPPARTPSTRSRSTAATDISAEYEVGRLLMEAKSLEFGEGTSELHTKMIAEFMLGVRKQ